MRKEQTKSKVAEGRKSFRKIKVNINDKGNLKNSEKQEKEKSSFVKTKRTDKLLTRLN